MAITILHTSDWHVGRRIGGRDRSDEHRRVLRELAEIGAAYGVDLTLVAGDLFDTASPTPAAEEIVWRALLDLAELAPVVVVSGNHDNAARFQAVAPLLQMGRVTLVSQPRRPDEGGVLHLEDMGARVAAIPFVSQRGIVKAEQIMGSDPDQHAGLYEERMRRLIQRLTEGMGTDHINILMGHLTVYGAQEGGGERAAHVFGYAIPASAFPGHLSYVALGHLHRQQKVAHSGSVWYSGSPLQLDFGEVDDRKGALLIEADPGLPARVTTIPLTTGRRLVTLSGTLEQVMARSDDVEDAYVKVVLAEKARVGLADEVRAAIPDVVSVGLLDTASDRPRVGRGRSTLSPIEAFHRFLEDGNVADPKVEALFAELLAEVTT